MAGLAFFATLFAVIIAAFWWAGGWRGAVFFPAAMLAIFAHVILAAAGVQAETMPVFSGVLAAVAILSLPLSLLWLSRRLLD